MNISLVKSLENIGSHAWNHLVRESPTNTIFQTYEWHVAWWAAFGQGNHPFIVCVTTDSGLTAVAPLMVTREEGQARVLRFIGHGRSDYLDFIYPRHDSAVLGGILGFIIDHADEWDRIELQGIPDYSESSQAILAASKGGGLHCFKADAVACPTLLFDHTGDPRQVVDRKSLKRHHSRLVSAGNYAVRHLTDPAEIMPHLERFFDQHVARWSVTDNPSLFLDSKNRAFYRAVVRNVAPNHWVVFTVVESQGAPVAFHFGFAYNGRFVWYKPSFEISMFRLSPGEALLKELFDYALAAGVNEFDFSAGEEAFKRRFANLVRDNLSYVIYKSRHEMMIRSAIRRFKQTAARFKVGRALRSRYRLLRGEQLPRVRESIRKHGLPSSGYRLGRHLFRRLIFDYVCVLLFDVPMGRAVKECGGPRLPGVAFREGNLRDMIGFEYSDSEVVRHRFIRQAYERLRRGNRCFVAEHDGRVVFAAWSREESKACISEIRTQVEIGPNSVSLVDGMTVPSLRGMGLAPFVLSRALNLLSDKRRVGYCLATNKSSERLILKVGFQPIGRYYLLNLFGVGIRWHKPVPGHRGDDRGDRS